MAYQIRDDCQRVALYVLVGADRSLVGMTVHNCRVVSMTFTEFGNIVLRTYGRDAYLHMLTSITEGKIILDKNDLIVLEIADFSGEQIGFYDRYLFMLMKLFKAEDIFPCYSIIYCCQEGNLVNQPFIHKVEYKHAVVPCQPRYKMNEIEKIFFPKWLDKYIPALFATGLNAQFENMLHSYDKSYLIGIPEMEYIMLFSILEMTFGAGNTEITYQISRGTALLLSQNADEMEQLYKRMKKLYNARSKYVHGGEKVKPENLFELRDIVRRVLIKLIDLEYHRKEKTFDELRNKILLGGFYSFAGVTSENA